MWGRESKRKLTVLGEGEISDSVRAKVLIIVILISSVVELLDSEID